MRSTTQCLATRAFALVVSICAISACVDSNPRNDMDVTSMNEEDPIALEEGALVDQNKDGCLDKFQNAACTPLASLVDGKTDVDNDGVIDALIIPKFCPEIAADGVTETGNFVKAAPEVCDGQDNNCNGIADEGNPDNDGDKIADCVDDDDDNDDLIDDEDCAPLDDKVNEKLPELCGDKLDNDCDGNTDDVDSIGCTLLYLDMDGDGYGQAESSKCLCAPSGKHTAPTDSDCNDSAKAINPKAVEECDTIDNNCNDLVDENEGADTDADGVKDCADLDDDDDGVLDEADNCSLTKNADQKNNDMDASGDACDTDDDDDGVLDEADNCPLANNKPQTDTDVDGKGDACDMDVDNDGLGNDEDNCIFDSNANQTDTDVDGKGDACDTDDDDDGVLDEADNCPTTLAKDLKSGEKLHDQTDTDADGKGNICDVDDDNDGVLDSTDNCPLTKNPGQEDQDKDKQGDACEDDVDGDGDPDSADCAPTNSSIHNGAVELCDGVDQDCDVLVDEIFIDTDKDGLADCVDSDSDNDGVTNDKDCAPLDPTVSPDKLELCNGKDDDCSGEADELPVINGKTCCKDQDDDGWCEANQTINSCNCNVAPYTVELTASTAGDCNDGNGDVNPGVTDVCGNGKDEDCSGKDADCACVPQCTGKVCGSNGCGAFCGSCAANAVCSTDGKSCIPNLETDCTGGNCCAGGQDDDLDGKMDCADPDCANDKVCGCANDADCPDNNPCTSNNCNVQNGVCSHSPLSGNACTDANLCTTDTVCNLGSCGGGAPTDCNDNNACTVDSCETLTGCKHVVSSAPGCAACNGAGDCKAGEVCENKVCKSDLKGQTPAGASGANGGLLADSTDDHFDNDGDGFCEVLPCTGSADKSLEPLLMKGGDCDDNPNGEGQFSLPCASAAPGCSFTTDGSWGNNPGVSDFPGDGFDNNCDGNVQ